MSKARNLSKVEVESTGDIAAGSLDNATPTALSNKQNTSTGAYSLPSGTTAERPGSPYTGSARYNTDTGSLEFYDGSTWISTNLIPTVDSVTGTIYAGAASNVTVAVTNATDTVTVRFSEGGSVVADVDSVDMSSGSASVAVPSAVYGQTAGDTISVSVINQDGTPSSNAINKTVVGLPTGGTITTSGSYRIHTFTSSSSFVVPSGLSLSNVDYLVIAGGGGGGRPYSGGGGAGGYRTSAGTSGGSSSAESKLSLSAGSYTVTVGGGGAGVVGDGVHAVGSNGQNSVFHTITSTGGGGGAPYSGYTPGNGGSGGGGGGEDSSIRGSGTSGQGTFGGYGSTGNIYRGGGGGGAASAGVAGGSSGAGGTGGAGLASSITGSSVTRAGGGGGGSYTSPGFPAGVGGVGGGGAGSVADNASAGQTNTGSGGGGAGGVGSGPNGGGDGAPGGSGIVIVRYQLS